MTSDGLDAADLTGRWVGFYRHRSAHLGAFPITAEIRQAAQRITGTMYDQITDREELLDRLLEIHGAEINPGTMRRLEAMIAEFGAGAVVVNVHLPETSDIEGTIAGGAVRFTKSYRGTHSVSWQVDGEPIRSAATNDHRVHYAGALDWERHCIVGEWTIRFRGFLGRFLPPAARGPFELYRKS